MTEAIVVPTEARDKSPTEQDSNGLVTGEHPTSEPQRTIASEGAIDPRAPAPAEIQVLAKPKAAERRAGSIVEPIIVVTLLISLSVAFVFAVISLADIAQRQRLANAFYEQSTPVDTAVEVADKIYEFPLQVLDIYHWNFKSPTMGESMVVKALRDAKALDTPERFNTLWNFFHLTDTYDTNKSDEVYVRWLRLDNPHMAAADAFDELSQSQEELGFSFEEVEFPVSPLQADTGESSEVAAVNIHNLFGEIADMKMKVVDTYVQAGRLIDAQNIVKRLAQWIRAYNVSYESAYENRANEIFVLELLMEDSKAVLSNQAPFGDLYGYIRGLEWDEEKAGPWWKDGEEIGPLPESLPQYASFQCQIRYLNMMRAARLKKFDEALERAATLSKDPTCMKLPLLKEWTNIGGYQARVADLLSRSCVTRANGDEVCDERSSTNETEFNALKKKVTQAASAVTLSKNTNLKDDLLTMSHTVRDARWNGRLPDDDSVDDAELPKVE